MYSYEPLWTPIKWLPFISRNTNENASERWQIKLWALTIEF